jgi:phage terminase large subunit-like protein
VKHKGTERIDGIVALIMAIGRAMLAREEPQPEYSLFFV